MKKVFLALSILFFAVLVKFVHTRAIVQKEFGPSSMLAAAVLTCAIVVLLVSFLLIKSRHREKLIGFWLVSMSSVVTYFLVDLLAGVFLITPLSPRVVADEVRHHKLVPNAHARFVHMEYSYTQRNNSVGLRGEDFDVDKSASTFRILTLGDSFTMGKGVADNKTFSVLLEENFNQLMQACETSYDNVEVLNGGTDSYAPILSYLYLSTELKSMRPDLVILSLDNSDLIQEAVYRGIAVRDDTGRIIAVPGEESSRASFGSLRHWIESNLYLTRTILFHTNKWLGYKDISVRGVVTRANSEITAHTLVSDQEDRSEQWASIFESLGWSKEFVEKEGGKFVLALYPWGHQVAEDEWVPGRYTYMSDSDQAIQDYDERLIELAQQSDISVVSVYSAFTGFAGDEKLYFDNDPHFTERGHEIMAAELEQLLIQQRHVEGLCR